MLKRLLFLLLGFSVIFITPLKALDISNIIQGITNGEISEGTITNGYYILKGEPVEKETFEITLSLLPESLRKTVKEYKESLLRRGEIIMFASIPATYFITKLIMEQISLYAFLRYDRALDDIQWRYITISTIVVPLFIVYDDYKKYIKYLEEKERKKE